MSLQTELTNLLKVTRIAPAGGAAAAEVVHTLISASAAGDNVIVPSPGTAMDILEIFLWNGLGTQTLQLRDGSLPLLRMTGLLASSGYLLGFTGSGIPHFHVSAGNPLILNLSVGTQVDGFVKYRLHT